MSEEQRYKINVPNKEGFDLSLPRKISSTHILCGDRDIAQLVIASKNATYEEIKKAREMYEGLEELTAAAKYDLAVMYYDGLGGPVKMEEGIDLMKQVVSSNRVLGQCAAYNIGRAYYEGVGVKQSDTTAEKWWLEAAQDGTPSGCVKAMCVLGMFYSRPGEDNLDLRKAHYWHQEGTGSGSIEAQAALGVMYEYGIQVEKNVEASFRCFKSAAERGSVYAMGQLALQYYKHKMFHNASEIGKRIGSMNDAEVLAQQTDCMLKYTRKGMALGCFVHGRCLEKKYVEAEDNETPLSWYQRSTHFDKDTSQLMQNFVTHGKI